MNFKRFVAFAFLALILWIVYREAERHTEPLSGPPTDWNAVYDNPAITRTITWLPCPRYPGGREDALGIRQLDQGFNVRIKPTFLDLEGYDSAKPLMFAAGDIPDVTWDGNPADVQRDIFHGCILPFSRELIQKYAPNYFRLITTYAPMGWIYVSQDGQNWGLPTIWMGGRLSTPGVWRKDWLEKVGIHKVPETLDEFHEAFRRFTFDDPNGDGKADTYGMTNTTVTWFQMFDEFFGAYGVLPFDWMEKDGQVSWGGTSPEARAALELLAGWYREGIIDPDMVTDGMGGDRRMREKFMNGRVGYASGLGTYGEFDPHQPGALVSVMAKLNPQARAVTAYLPIGPQGQRGSRNWGTAANFFVIGTGVAREPAKLIRVLKIIEAQTSNDPATYLRYVYGQEGKHWKYRVPDTGAVGTGPSGGIYVIPPYDDAQAYERDLLTIWGVSNPEVDDLITPAAQKEFEAKYDNPRWCLLDAIGRSDVLPSSSKYLADLVQWQMSVYTDIIRGVKPISYFDKFRIEWHRRGGDVLTGEANAFMQQKKALYQQLGIHE